MKREWENLDGWGMILGCIWFFGGMVWFVLSIDDRASRGHRETAESHVAEIVWLTPFALLILGGIIYALWHERPRRVLRPVTEDAREAHKR